MYICVLPILCNIAYCLSHAATCYFSMFISTAVQHTLLELCHKVFSLFLMAIWAVFTLGLLWTILSLCVCVLVCIYKDFSRMYTNGRIFWFMDYVYLQLFNNTKLYSTHTFREWTFPLFSSFIILGIVKHVIHLYQ